MDLSRPTALNSFQVLITWHGSSRQALALFSEHAAQTRKLESQCLAKMLALADPVSLDHSFILPAAEFTVVITRRIQFIAFSLGVSVNWPSCNSTSCLIDDWLACSANGIPKSNKYYNNKDKERQ